MESMSDRYDCGVTYYSIPNNVTKIGENVFSGCTTIEHVVMTESVTDIKDGAFANCTALRSILFPDSVTRMGKG